jgi:hypothetical protein
MRLTATGTTPPDEARCYRAMLAYLDGDQLAFDTVLADVMADPTGTSGLLFLLLEIAADVSVTLDPDVRDRLRDALG